MLLHFFKRVSREIRREGHLARLPRPLLFAAIISFLAVLVASGFAFSANAAPLEDVPQTLVQPDGEELHVFATGDEFYHWLHDANGYVIVQDPSTGFYVYAVEQNGDIVPSQYIVGKVDPAQAGLTPNIRVSPEKYQQRRASLRPAAEPMTPVPSVNTGTLNNLVVFIRFSDESEFGEDLSAYDDMLNDDTAGANSLRNYYREVSYDQLTVSSTLYPTTTGTTVVSYQDSHARNYYRPYNATSNTDGYSSSDMAGREHDLLRSALNSIKSQVPAGLNLDNNNDGKVDNVAFIVSGTSDGWSDLLWPHMWWLPGSNTVTINNKQVSAYNLELQAQLNAGRGVGILAHEMFHTLGAPDLYHYSYDGLHPAWKWDLMEWDLNPPEHMGAYMKQRYGGWIASIPEITASGTYTLNPLTSSTNNAYKIASPNSGAEYFVVEYRKKAGTFESSLPGEGLLVYRIDTARDGQGNRDGPPDEVYVYRPDGRKNADGRRDDAAFSSESGRTALNDDTNPRPFLSDGGPGGLRISGVGAIGDTISFRVDFGSIVTDTNAVSVLEDGTGTFGVKLSEQPSGDVVVSVSRQSGDMDITVQAGASLTFTATNWNTYQTVTLADARDDDFRNDSAIIRVDGPGMSHVDVTATENDLYGVGISWPGASVPFYDGFESGALSGAWKKNPWAGSVGIGVGSARIQVKSGFSPHGGSNHVMMDTQYGDDFGELVLSVDLEGKKDVTLSFWHKEDWHQNAQYSDPRPVIPESFAEHYHGRGVAVSNDGGTWYRIDPLDSGKDTYTFHNINLDTITDQVKLPYSSHFLIKFQWSGYDSNTSIRAAWFDDISVSAGRKLSLITPTGTGERGLAGWSRTIAWTSSGNIGADVKIELYKDDSLDSTIAYSTPNDGNFSWPIPVTQQHDFDYRVKVSAIDDPDVYDISDNDFEIYGAELTLTSPNGGERWQQYSTHNITWNSVNYTGPVKIELFKGGALERTLNAAAFNDGSEIWNISSSQPAGDDYKVRITAVDVPSVSDWGDENFSVYAPGLVLKSPNGGEHLMRGSTYTITWDKVGNPGATVKLELFKGGVLSNTIYTWTANNGSVPWSVLSGQQPGLDYRIRITDLSFPDATDQSDADFEIVPGSIKIIAPAVGARFQQGAYVDVYWGDTGDPGATVKVEVFKGGILNTLVITDWSEHVGWARWGIPIGQAPGTDYSIKVTSLAFPTVHAMTKQFEIYEGSVQLIVPDGGEGWEAGSTYDITWTSTYPATAAVKLDLYKSGALDSTIVASTENDGSYNWPIPSGQAASTTYRVKLSFVTAPSISDSSDNDFKIEAVGIGVTSPNGGERWQRGTAHGITWTSIGNPGPDVKIELYKAGALDSIISTSTPDDGSYSWPIQAGQTLGMDYRVKVSSVSSPALNDASNADFIIGDVAPTLATISPNSGTNNASAGAFELTGTGFVSGATVKLMKTGQPDIIASGVSVVSGTTITLVLDLSGKAAGLWDVVVANADGQSATLPTGFTVQNPPPMVFWITPNRATTETGILQITDLMGQGFLPGATVKLSQVQQPDIVATNVVVVSSTRITCTFDLTDAQVGIWDIIVYNDDGRSATLPGLFSVVAPLTVTTTPAANVTVNSATLKGSLTGVGTASFISVSFQYGITTVYGSTTLPRYLGSPADFSDSIAGLTPGITYHFRARADGGIHGVVYGQDMTFTTSVTPPSLTTGAVTAIGVNSATLNGMLSSLGTADRVTVSFDYGLTESYTYNILAQDRQTAGNFSTNIILLTPGKTYHYRAKADGGVHGIVYGRDAIFTTATTPPTVSISAASNVSSNSATLNANLDGLGTASDVYVSFEYGPTTSYDSSTASQLKVSLSSFSANIADLIPGTAYHYRAKADGGTQGVAYSDDVTFTTDPAPTTPVVLTIQATDVSSVSATLHGNLKSLGGATSVNVSFQYGAGTQYGITVAVTPAKTAEGTFTASITGLLSPSTTYHFRTKADGGTYGVAYGNDVTFTTGPTPTWPPLEVITSVASSVGSNSATLNGNLLSMPPPTGGGGPPGVGGGETSVSVSFQYGTSTNYGSATNVGTVASTGPFSIGVANLAPGTTYHFRAKAESAGYAPAFGADVVVTTMATPPLVTTISATAVTPNSATLGGNLTSKGSAGTVNVSFDYGTTTGYGKHSDALARTANGSFAISVTDLRPGTTYHFRARADGGTHGLSTGADLSLTTMNSYALTLSVNGNGGTSPAVGTYHYGEGSIVSIAATPAPGWQFLNWGGDVGTIVDVSAASTTISMNGAYSIIATFAQAYDLQISSIGGGSVTSPGEGVFTRGAGQVVNLVAVSQAGYRFVGWSGDTRTIADTGSPVTTVTADGDLSIIANFELILRGDVNRDGKVDLLDLVAVSASFHSNPPSNPDADLNGDGSVDIFDLVLVGLDFGKTSR